MVKDSKRHIDSLKDGRTIFIDGRRVADVTTDPAFAHAVATAGNFYDFQAAPQNIDAMTFTSPKTGDQVSRAWQLPRNHRELVERREALVKWSRMTCGMVGRSPDHVASTMAGFRMGLHVFHENNPARARAVESYYEYARDNDLYLSYVIINPQSDKAKSASGQPDPHLVASVVDEDSTGITIRGAKMLATSGIMANEVLVSGFQALQAGDEAYAFTAAVPIGAKGLTLMSRRSYEQNATSTFDYPLSAQFDENDAVIYFDVDAERADGDFVAGLAIFLWTRGMVEVGTVAMALPLAWQIVNIAGWVAWQITDIFENIGVVQEGMSAIATPARPARQAGRQAARGHARRDRVRQHPLRLWPRERTDRRTCR